MSVAGSIYLYLIELLISEWPSGVEYYHLELPSEFSKETVLFPSYHENAYKNASDLPNANPRCPQLVAVLPIVFLIQIASVEKVIGSNFNKCCPEQPGLG